MLPLFVHTLKAAIPALRDVAGRLHDDYGCNFTFNFHPLQFRLTNQMGRNPSSALADEFSLCYGVKFPVLGAELEPGNDL